jgi:hypothetical protein
MQQLAFTTQKGALPILCPIVRSSTGIIHSLHPNVGGLPLTPAGGFLPLITMFRPDEDEPTYCRVLQNPAIAIPLPVFYCEKKLILNFTVK